MKTLYHTDKFIIRKRTRKSNGKTYYELSLNYWEYNWSVEACGRVRDIVDPTRNRSGQFGRSWKYQTCAAAERDLTMLLMQL